MTAVSVTQQETEAAFFGCAIENMYPQWNDFERQFQRQHDGTAPNGWAYAIRVVDPANTERLMTKTITHSVLLGAMRRIVEQQDMRAAYTSNGRVYLRNPEPETRNAVVQYCLDWNPDHLDPEVIDQVLQVAVFGGIVNL